MADVSEVSSAPIEVRNSNVHGRGVFATRRIEKGERIIEYLGERVSHEEADRRYESKEENDSHTFLFIVDSKTVIDAVWMATPRVFSTTRAIQTASR